MKSLEQLLAEIDADEFYRRVNSDPKPRTSREFVCPICKSRCTRLTDGHSEAGHDFGCPRQLRRTGSYRAKPALIDGGEVVR